MEQDFKNERSKTIFCAKLIDELFLYAEWDEYGIINKEGGKLRKCKDTFTYPIHPDLRAAFKKLDAHLAGICDELKAKEIIKVIDKYRADQFKFVGKGDERNAVLITGGKRTMHGFVSLVTPTQTFTTSKYHSISELELITEELCSEIELYIDAKKIGIMPQMKMDFDGDLNKKTEDTEDIPYEEVKNPELPVGQKLLNSQTQEEQEGTQHAGSEPAQDHPWTEGSEATEPENDQKQKKKTGARKKKPLPKESENDAGADENI